ncbi:hypothetical protein US8_03640 [Bacillus altitudinis]|nr:hypothetical protein US8_03640 [Bacillus altitudinis]
MIEFTKHRKETTKINEKQIFIAINSYLSRLNFHQKTKKQTHLSLL